MDRTRFLKKLNDELNVIDAIVKLLDANPDFVLTGSRSLDMADSTSDVDFFINDYTYMAKYRNQILDLGFEILSEYEEHHDNDPSLVAVLRYRSPMFGIQFDIQIIKSFYYMSKFDAQQTLAEACKLMPAFMRMALKDKKLARQLWTGAILGFVDEEA